MDSGCLGNLVSLRVPATTGGGPCGDTGDGVSLSRGLEESSYTLFDQKEFLCVYPAIAIKYLYVCYSCPEMYIILY